jgi:hypothetical protein
MARHLWKPLLIAVLCVSLTEPARAETFDTLGKQIYTGIAVVSAAVVVGIVLIVLHERHKIRTVTGCIASGNLTDDTDKRVYTLSGDPVGIKSGERMELEGKRRGKVFEARSVIKDLGVCQP